MLEFKFWKMTSHNWDSNFSILKLKIFLKSVQLKIGDITETFLGLVITEGLKIQTVSRRMAVIKFSEGVPRGYKMQDIIKIQLYLLLC